MSEEGQVQAETCSYHYCHTLWWRLSLLTEVGVPLANIFDAEAPTPDNKGGLRHNNIIHTGGLIKLFTFSISNLAFVSSSRHPTYTPSDLIAR